jgi:alkanesulfonate monooxygenase SsuD/methylene tetrahydromethanopterin reductase-like flavin-dependent oxidoreductase (luciferase family)
MWTYVTEDKAVANRELAVLSAMLNRPEEKLGPQVVIGPPEECASKLRAYQKAGVANVFIWPLADETEQLQVFAKRVAPLVPDL